MAQKGEVVDRYRLDERLGAGAFGEVWKASQLADGEDVGVTCAVKLMKVSAERASSSARLIGSGWLDEVRNLVRVGGDTIPRIFEANVWNDHAYIAMELLPGQPLSARLAQGPVPWRRALYIAGQIAHALASAHQVGVVHRDLKPQNVVLVGSTRVCVIDWGIASLNSTTNTTPQGVARREAVDLDATNNEVVAPITAPKPRPVAIGTPGYMAPESYEAALPAPAQDVFALGVVLYEMLAGCLPHAVERFDRSSANPDSVRAYRGALDKATMDYEIVPILERVPELPVEVAKLVDALLARDPEQRPRDVRAAIERANRFPNGVPTPPYAGLVKLGPERSGLYFGQQDTIKHVLERLKSQRAVLLWGPSGSGKSSLALAGVAATMDRVLFADMDGWTIHAVRPRERALKPATGEPAPSTLGQIVVVDQLEEVVDMPEADRADFCAALLALLDGTGPVSVRGTTVGTTQEVRLVATIRDDLEWRVDREVPALRPLLERRIIVKGVDANFAKSIIEEPARACGYAIEGIDAVSREVEERLSADASKLPVVQYALSEWWERRDESKHVLPAAAWHELGGVDGALSFVAERFYSTLDGARQESVKALLMQMFLGGRKQPLAETKLSASDRTLLDELTKIRLVGRRERQGSTPFYEVEHESLAENWTRLAGWLAEAREDRALVEEVEREAEAFERDHDRHRLWKKARLASANQIAARHSVPLSQAATRFISESSRQERRARVMSWSLLGGAAALILGVVYALVLNNAASAQRDKAMAELRNAELANEQAQKQLERARDDRMKAEQALVEAAKWREQADLEKTQLAEAKQRAEADAAALKKATEDLKAREKQLMLKNKIWESGVR